MSAPLISTRALNRATLARQYLLERADVPVLGAHDVVIDPWSP